MRAITSPLPSRRASPPIGRYQIILLGDRDTCVNNSPRVALGNAAGGIRTRDVLIGHRVTDAVSYFHQREMVYLVLQHQLDYAQ